MADMGNITFQWDDEQRGRHGEGISRPKEGAKTREFKAHVYPAGGSRVTWITKAENKRALLKYADARWPGARVEVV